MENQKTFRLGIAMAGAVSAGAYTAGAMDYLLEALESWQKAKDLGLPCLILFSSKKLPGGPLITRQRILPSTEPALPVISSS